MNRFAARYLLVCFATVAVISAQETRSMLFGRVLDPQGAAIVGAKVFVRNAETGVSINLTTKATNRWLQVQARLTF